MGMANHSRGVNTRLVFRIDWHMDFITQNILGAAAGQAALARRLGWRAAILGAAGGAVPDFDFLLRRFADPAFPIEFHRHFTHSIVFIPIGGVIAALPFMILPSVRREWKLAIAAAIIGCATHALLDCCTSYGTMWYWPFTDRRIAWDLIAIIDPMVTLPLLLGVIISWRKKTRTAATWALIWSVFYMGIGYVQRERAFGAQRAVAAQRGHTITRGRVFPTLGNLLFWRSVYETNGQLWADAIYLNNFTSPRVDLGESIARFTRDELPPVVGDESRVRIVFEKFNAFAEGYLAVMPADSNPHVEKIFLGDMRYSRTMNGFSPLWGIEIDPDNPLQPVRWIGWKTSTAEVVDRLKE